MQSTSKRLMAGLGCVVLLTAAEGGCDDKSAASKEQKTQNLQMEQFLRNQPVPAFDWSLERHMMLQLYAARQKATNTFSIVQSEFTGKVLWSCPSIGFPIPYTTQLTNPQQVRYYNEHLNAVVAQQEPNGLFTPSQSDATWVPCVDEKGRITPVYEESTFQCSSGLWRSMTVVSYQSLAKTLRWLSIRDDSEYRLTINRPTNRSYNDRHRH